MSERGGGGTPGNPPRIPGLPGNAHFHEIAEFRTLNVQRPRPSIHDQEMAWCQNLMPIGAYYLRALPDRAGTAIFGVPAGPPQAVRLVGTPFVLAVDGVTNGRITALAPINASGTTVTVGPLTTTKANDIVILINSVHVQFFPPGYPNCTQLLLPSVVSITGGGLTWIKRAFVPLSTPVLTGFSQPDHNLCYSGYYLVGIEIWYAIATTVLNGVNFTVTLSGTSASDIAGCFAVAGVNTLAPWVGVTQHAGNPVGAPGAGTATIIPLTTTLLNEFVFGFFAGYTNPVFSYTEIPTPGWGELSGGPAVGNSVPGWVDAAILIGGANGAWWNQAIGIYQVFAAPQTVSVSWANGALANSWLGVADSLAGYVPGTSTILTISSLANLPATADTLLIAGWISNAAGVVDILTDTGVAGVSLAVNLGSNSVWTFTARQANGATIVSGTTTVAGDLTSGWHSFALSARMSTQTAQLLIDSTLYGTTFTWSSNNPVGYPSESWQVGPVANIGDFSSLWFGAGMPFFDLSVVGNVHTLFGPTNCWVSWGSSGQLVTGSSPPLFLYGDQSSYPNNLGTGGAFTVNGRALITAPGPTACP